MRGKLFACEFRAVDSRLIPACAGKTSPPIATGLILTAHPRVCGENPIGRRAPDSCAGSSPRVRGKLLKRCAQTVITGLIPACAGKTLRPRKSLCTSRAHPRVCGENFVKCVRVFGCVGSSPRVRGKPGSMKLNKKTLGLIPACAGKTRKAHRDFLHAGAHPRVCGENNSIIDIMRVNGGSSPRVRGKQALENRVSTKCGLIPACAGKTKSHSRLALRLRAHPRVCGENGKMPNPIPSRPGSSPRVRGKLCAWFWVHTPGGLIPACAGKTLNSHEFIWHVRAHPRVCGENSDPTQSNLPQPGSSPRVRGKLPRGRPEVHNDGLIPACAGKTGDVESGTTKRRAHPRVCGENMLPLT